MIVVFTYCYFICIDYTIIHKGVKMKNNKDFDLNNENLQIIDGYFRASNYLSATQLYLKSNPLLREKLQMQDIKAKIVGHWGTVPGQNFVYTHLDRAICKYDLDMILISGPGHGGNFFIANSYLEGYYSEIYKYITQDKQGMTNLCRQFSYPYGVGSHTEAKVPGSINEGGELGYSLAHAYGAVFDNPNLICACIVGDGEAETGPLATSWHSNKFINPATDGAVLPILHLNGYKISNPTILSRISRKELLDLFHGYGYKPYIVEGNDPIQMHKKMASTLDKAIEEILKIQKTARNAKKSIRPLWPMIILITPKGWTGPKEIDGKQIEGTFRAHQVPLQIQDQEDINALENWLKSYKPEELFDEDYKLKNIYKKFIPKGNKRLSANPHANGGLLLKEIILPDPKTYALDIENRGSVYAQDMLELSKFIRDVFVLNDKNKNFRYFSPDEAMSNRLYSTFEVQNRAINARTQKDDEYLSSTGRIMDSYLSEHMCEGWLEGYILTGRHGFFASYESFIRVIDSMASQHIKWLKECDKTEFRKDISSLNLILTSNVWQQDHNGFSHQDPGFLNHIVNKQSSMCEIYLPFDANTLIVSYDKCSKTKNQVNIIVASKHPSLQWLSMDEAIAHTEKGIGIWDWASNNPDNEPDIILACAGDTPTLETLACAKILREKIPDLNVRFVNVINLMTLDNNENHRDGLDDVQFDQIFTKNKPVIFCFHGYAKLIHELIYKRTNQEFHVQGYKEKGTITTPFDMRVINKIDRFNLVKICMKYLPAKFKEIKEQIIQEMQIKLENHQNYIKEYGEDMPEIKNWKW